MHSYFKSRWGHTCFVHWVLILVLMEDALVQTNKKKNEEKWN